MVRATMSSNTGSASDVAYDTHPWRDRTSSAVSDTLATHGDGVELSGDGHPTDLAPMTALTWIGRAVVDGLVHCACTHTSVNPELLTLASGSTPAPVASRSDEAGQEPQAISLHSV